MLKRQRSLLRLLSLLPSLLLLLLLWLLSVCRTSVSVLDNGPSVVRPSSGTGTTRLFDDVLRWWRRRVVLCRRLLRAGWFRWRFLDSLKGCPERSHQGR